MKMPLNQMPMLDGSAPKGLDKEFDWGPTVAPLEQTKDHVSAKWAADQLLKKDFGGQPFFMALGISKPHLAWYVPQEFFDMHPLEDVIVPEIHEDDLDDILNKYGKKKFKPNVDFLRVQKYNKFKEVTQAYLAAVSYADACIGVALDALEKSPHRDNTIVAIWGDHGWFLGEKMRYGKTNLWEESTRVPLIMKIPGRVESGTHTKGIVNLIDLYPTLAEFCGLPSNPDIDGKSFAPLIKNPEKPWEEPTLTTIGFKNHSLRGPRYRFSQYIDGTEELYDELKDPNERTNLINSPEHASVIESYRAMMPKHNEPEMTRNEIDKKRLGRALDKLKKQSRELRQMYYDNTMDPELVKATYHKTK
jgi:arylsulfatase A-like enzyme